MCLLHLFWAIIIRLPHTNRIYHHTVCKKCLSLEKYKSTKLHVMQQEWEEKKRFTTSLSFSMCAWNVSLITFKILEGCMDERKCWNVCGLVFKIVSLKISRLNVTNSFTCYKNNFLKIYSLFLNIEYKKEHLVFSLLNTNQFLFISYMHFIHTILPLKNIMLIWFVIWYCETLRQLR